MSATLTRPLRTTLDKGSRIRVLVVDDSVVIRRLVTQALASDPDIEVIGSAPDGRIALQKIEQLRPDLITLDIEMPELSGLQVLEYLRKAQHNLRTIMVSTLTERGASVTLAALSLGADDYVTKAANAGSLDRSMEALRSELIPKVKQFFRFPSTQGESTASPAKPTIQHAKSKLRLRQILAIGVSTGGPTALATLMPMFPKNFPLPLVVVQHMPPMFTRLLAERLNSLTPLQVEEATEGAIIEPGRVLIAPGNFHMQVQKVNQERRAVLNQDAHENSCRPAVDVLFRSIADVYESSAIAVVLTGMGSDGLKGVETLRAKGAYIIAQDEPTSVVWGMPGAVVKAGLADATVPLEAVVPQILQQL